MRTFILGIGTLGFFFFGAVFILSFVSPLSIEVAAREVVRLEVERRTRAKIDDLSSDRIAAVAKAALKQAESELTKYKNELNAEIPQRIADVITNMQNADCECRKHLIRASKTAVQDHVSGLEQARLRLNSLIESAYSSVTRNLLREVRIFSGSNASAFALLLLITWYRRAASLQLLLPTFVLIGAVTLTGGLYLFNQDWLHTVVYSEYVGFSYMLYLVAVALCFTDIAFNKARLTSLVINTVSSMVGSALHALPC